MPDIRIQSLFPASHQLSVSLIEDQGDGTFQVYFDAMEDGEILGVQANVSRTRAEQLGLLDENGEPVNLSGSD